MPEPRLILAGVLGSAEQIAPAREQIARGGVDPQRDELAQEAGARRHDRAVTLDHWDDVRGRGVFRDREVAGERSTGVGRDLLLQRVLLFGHERFSFGCVIMWGKRLLSLT